MAYVQKAGTGTIYQNDTKGNSKAPIMKGTITTPHGEILELAFWTATDKDTGEPRLDKNQKKFYSVKVQVPRSAGDGSEGITNDLNF